ncbi:MAG: YkgJ family cysteine cluster protein, partial [Candidatus Thermochlorobacter sp.]
MCKTLETNLQVIATRARQLDQENQDFKVFLHRIPSPTLDTLVATLNAEVEAQIDCTTCGNCCKHLHAAALETELPALAAYQQLSVEEFKTQFLTPYKEAFYFSVAPCP